jgi:dihydropteroate synthase
MNQPEHLNYTNLSSEIMRFFVAQIKKFKDHGVYQIIVDPGFGFSKSLAQNFELLANLHLLSILDCPILVGISRKSMIYKQTNNDPEDALNGTTAAHMLALMEGAQILRVHDVKAAKQAVSIFNQYTKHKVINLS